MGLSCSCCSLLGTLKVRVYLVYVSIKKIYVLYRYIYSDESYNPDLILSLSLWVYTRSHIEIR
jgi:hypothetical protein